MTPRRSLAVMVASMVMWGLANPFSDIAMDELTPAQTYVTEVGVGLAAFVLTVLAIPSLRPRLRSIPWRLSLPFGVIMPGLCYYTGNIGYNYASITTGVILLSTEVLFTSIGGVLLLRERMSRRAAGAILVGMAGAIAVGITGQQHSPEAIGRTFTLLGLVLPASLVGGAAFVVSSFFSGWFAVLARRHAASVDVIALTLGQLISALGFGAVLVAATRADLTTATAHPANLAAAGAAGFLGSAMAFLLFNLAASGVPTRQTAIALNLIPVVAIVTAGVIGRGWPTWAQVGGATVVLASLLFLEAEEHVEAPVPAH